MKASHPEVFRKFDAKAKAQATTNSLKRIAAKAPGASKQKQMKMTDFFGHSKAMLNAVHLAVNNGVAFSVFDSPDMRQLTNKSKAHDGEQSAKVVSASNVKAAIRDIAEEKREEIKKLLTDKVVNISADFATCQRRSFLGECYEYL